MKYLLLVIMFVLILIFTKKKLQTKQAHKLVNNCEIEKINPWKIESTDKIDWELYEFKDLKLSENFKKHITELVKLTPTAKDIIKNEEKIIIKFSKEITDRLNSKELSLMKKKGTFDNFRTIAVDDKNIIRGHGWKDVKKFKKINPAKLAHVAHGVLTIVAAQEHLEKINQQLSIIDNKIYTLIRQYHNDKLGNIQGSIHYLKSILPELENENSSTKQIYLAKLEDISLQCYKETESLYQELPYILKEIGQIKEKTLYNLNSIADHIIELTISFEKNLLLCLGNLEVMSICLNLRTKLEENHDVNLKRLEDIQNYYDKLITIHNKLNYLTKDKQMGLSGKLRTNKAILNVRNDLEKQLAYHSDKIKGSTSDIKFQLEQFNDKSPPKNEVTDLVVEYDNGNIIKISKLRHVS